MISATHNFYLAHLIAALRNYNLTSRSEAEHRLKIASQPQDTFSKDLGDNVARSTHPGS